MSTSSIISNISTDLGLSPGKVEIEKDKSDIKIRTWIEIAKTLPLLVEGSLISLRIDSL